MSSHETLPNSGLGLHKPGKESKPSHNVRKIVIGGIASTLIAGGTYFGIDRLVNSGSDIIPDPIITDPLTPAERCKAIEMAEELGVVHISDTECKKELTPEQKKQVEIQRVLALMPNFEGFQKAMKEVEGVEKYVYVAQKGNRYGVEVGAIGGFYKEEVTFEGEKVGGIAFVPKIVEKLLADKDGKAFFIPADISEINSKDFVDMELSNIYYDGKTYQDFWIKVDTHGNKVSLSSPSYEYIINNRVTANPDHYSEQITGGFLAYAEDGNRYAMKVIGNFVFDKHFQERLPLGTKIISTSETFGVMFNSTFSSLMPIVKEEVLVVENSVVFLKDTN